MRMALMQVPQHSGKLLCLPEHILHVVVLITGHTSIQLRSSCHFSSPANTVALGAQSLTLVLVLLP
jgi:hypothetical protein